MVELKDLCKIGIGSFRIGGFNHEILVEHQADNSKQKKEYQELIDSVVYSINKKGQNYIDVSWLYANGTVVKFIADVLKKIDRNKIFLSLKIESPINKKEDIEEQVDQYLKVLNIKQADAIMTHGPGKIAITLDEVHSEMQRLVKIGKARYTGMSNYNFEQIKLASKYNVSFLETVYNLECKVNEDLGIIDFCKQNNIIFIPFQPLRRNRTAKRNYPVLAELAKKYNKTQNQIILNWIVLEKKLFPILKSTTISNIDENIDSLNFRMEKADYQKLNEFRSAEFDAVKIDWNLTGDGIAIHQLANQFE